MQPRRPVPSDIVGDRYVIERPLAEGGMGAVYIARHRTTDATVALKVLLDPTSQPDIVKTRFVREAKVAAALGHPGIVKVLDAGDDAQFGPFLVMELLDGEALDTYIYRANPPLDERLAIVREMLEALAAAHDAGIVHRDVKPENVFLANDGEGGIRVKLLDFGIARVQAATKQTTDGTALGTIFYMAPEQLVDASNASTAADVWAVGVMLYEMISGELPFDGASIHEVAVRVCTQNATPLSTLVPDVDPQLDAVVQHCMQREKVDRPQTARELAQMFDALGVQRLRVTRLSIPGASKAPPPLTPSVVAPAPAIQRTVESSPGASPRRSQTTSTETPPTAIDRTDTGKRAPKWMVWGSAGALAVVVVAGSFAMRQRNSSTIATTQQPATQPTPASRPATPPQPSRVEQPRVATETAPTAVVAQTQPSQPSQPSAQTQPEPAARVAAVNARLRRTNTAQIATAPAARVEPAPTAIVSPTVAAAATTAVTPSVSATVTQPANTTATTPTVAVAQRPVVTPTVAPTRPTTVATQPRRPTTTEPEVEAPLTF